MPTMLQVRDNLLARAREFNIIVDDVAITHLSFGTEFTKAVEAKQVAQQEAERARYGLHSICKRTYTHDVYCSGLW